MAALVGLCPTADFQPLLPYKCTGGSGLPRPQGTHRQRMFVWLPQDSGNERYFRDRLTRTCRCHGSRMWTGWLGGGIRSSLGKAWARVRGVISWGCTPGLINPEQPYHSLTHRLSSIHPSIRILGAADNWDKPFQGLTFPKDIFRVGWKTLFTVWILARLEAVLKYEICSTMCHKGLRKQRNIQTHLQLMKEEWK